MKPTEQGYIPKADATRGATPFDYPQDVKKIEADQTASHEEDPGKHEAGGCYGDGW